MPGAVGLELAAVIREVIWRHATCNECEFAAGAAERIIDSKEFAALARRIEAEEIACEHRVAPAETRRPSLGIADWLLGRGN
jgi:hypothetical protein